MGNIRRILFSLILMISLVAIFYFIAFNISQFTGKVVSGSSETSFEKCLDTKEIYLYVNTANVSDSLKESQIEGYLSHFKIFNCLRNNKLCNEKGISSFPSLVIDDNKVEGDISLSDLSRLSECSI